MLFLRKGSYLINIIRKCLRKIGKNKKGLYESSIRMFQLKKYMSGKWKGIRRQKFHINWKISVITLKVMRILRGARITIHSKRVHPTTRNLLTCSRWLIWSWCLTVIRRFPHYLCIIKKFLPTSIFLPDNDTNMPDDDQMPYEN